MKLQLAPTQVWLRFWTSLEPEVPSSIQIIAEANTRRISMHSLIGKLPHDVTIRFRHFSGIGGSMNAVSDVSDGGVAICEPCLTHLKFRGVPKFSLLRCVNGGPQNTPKLDPSTPPFRAKKGRVENAISQERPCRNLILTHATCYQESTIRIAVIHPITGKFS